MVVSAPISFLMLDSLSDWKNMKALLALVTVGAMVGAPYRGEGSSAVASVGRLGLESREVDPATTRRGGVGLVLLTRTGGRSAAEGRRVSLRRGKGARSKVNGLANGQHGPH